MEYEQKGQESRSYESTSILGVQVPVDHSGAAVQTPYHVCPDGGIAYFRSLAGTQSLRSHGREPSPSRASIVPHGPLLSSNIQEGPLTSEGPQPSLNVDRPLDEQETTSMHSAIPPSPVQTLFCVSLYDPPLSSSLPTSPSIGRGGPFEVPSPEMAKTEVSIFPRDLPQPATHVSEGEVQAASEPFRQVPVTFDAFCSIVPTNPTLLVLQDAAHESSGLSLLETERPVGLEISASTEVASSASFAPRSEARGADDEKPQEPLRSVA